MAANNYYNKVAKNFIDSAKTQKQITGIDVLTDIEDEYFPKKKRGMNKGTLLILSFLGYFIGYIGGIYLVIRFIGSFIK